GPIHPTNFPMAGVDPAIRVLPLPPQKGDVGGRVKPGHGVIYISIGCRRQAAGVCFVRRTEASGEREIAMESEAELLASARRYSFRARMDGKEDLAGPVFVSGSGSEVEDVNGKRYLDF